MRELAKTLAWIKRLLTTSTIIALAIKANKSDASIQCAQGEQIQPVIAARTDHPSSRFGMRPGTQGYRETDFKRCACGAVPQGGFQLCSTCVVPYISAFLAAGFSHNSDRDEVQELSNPFCTAFAIASKLYAGTQQL